MPAFSQGEVSVEVNGDQVSFPDQEPFIDPVTEDRTGKHVEMEIGSKAPTVDGEEKSLDAPARLINSRTVVPLRFVSEALGAKVEWIADTRTVVITDDSNNGSDGDNNGSQDSGVNAGKILEGTWGGEGTDQTEAQPIPDDLFDK